MLTTAASEYLTLDSEPLDTSVSVVTPERIVFQYPVAGPFRRIFAYLIDMTILGTLVAVAAIVSFALSLGSISGLGMILVAYFALTWGYGAFSEAVFNGQTLGKRALSLRVISEQGTPINASQAVLRNLVGSVDGLVPFFYMLSLSSMLLTSRFQRLGDLAAGTMVVVEQRQRRAGIIRIQDRETEAILPWLPVRIAASPELARALSDYVQKRERFRTPLREEVAATLAAPLRKVHALPADASSDAVLCAVYHRVFLGE